MLDKEKIPLKRVEISIQKFNEVGIPHHLSLLRNHKTNIKKSLALGDWDKIQKEQINATRVVKQLRTLLMEMDSLRNKLANGDVKKFDELILTSRQSAMEEIKSYLDLQLKSPSESKSSFNEGDSNETTLDIQSVPQIQAEFHISEHQIKSREACLAQFERLQEEIRDLRDMLLELHGEVHSQKEVCGGLIGMCVGGPIGLIAGAKIGAGAAVCFAFLGYSGGTAIKKREEKDETPATQKDE
ncbi:Syntaxin-17, partial [Pseudolycoriella hygida]